MRSAIRSAFIITGNVTASKRHCRLSGPAVRLTAGFFFVLTNHLFNRALKREVHPKVQSFDYPARGFFASSLLDDISQNYRSHAAILDGRWKVFRNHRVS